MKIFFNLLLYQSNKNLRRNQLEYFKGKINYNENLRNWRINLLLSWSKINVDVLQFFVPDDLVLHIWKSFSTKIQNYDQVQFREIDASIFCFHEVKSMSTCCNSSCRIGWFLHIWKSFSTKIQNWSSSVSRNRRIILLLSWSEINVDVLQFPVSDSLVSTHLKIIILREYRIMIKNSVSRTQRINLLLSWREINVDVLQFLVPDRLVSTHLKIIFYENPESWSSSVSRTQRISFLLSWSEINVDVLQFFVPDDLVLHIWKSSSTKIQNYDQVQFPKINIVIFVPNSSEHCQANEHWLLPV
jgi:hypothetical protein